MFFDIMNFDNHISLNEIVLCYLIELTNEYETENFISDIRSLIKALE